MPSLHELQRDFLAVMLRRDDGAALERHLEHRGDTSRRIGVYKANARENFAVALEAAFPVLLGQLGADEFRRMAWSFQRRHPSPSGNLFEVGRALPGFLAATVAGSPDEWLRDLAALEWAVQEAMTAADDDRRFDAAVLADIAPEDHGRLRLALHPSVRLLVLQHPCFAAWQAHQAGDQARKPSGPDREHLLVRRAGDGIELHRLDAAGHGCLTVLAAGEPLERAVARPGATDFDPGACLAHWAAAGVIIAVERPHRAAP